MQTHIVFVCFLEKIFKTHNAKAHNTNNTIFKPQYKNPSFEQNTIFTSNTLRKAILFKKHTTKKETGHNTQHCTKQKHNTTTHYTKHTTTTHSTKQTHDRKHNIKHIVLTTTIQQTKTQYKQHKPQYKHKRNISTAIVV